MARFTTLCALPLSLLLSFATAQGLDIETTKAVECSRKTQDGDKTTPFAIVDGEGPANAFNFNVLNADGTTKEERTLEMPRRISIRNNVVEDRRLTITEAGTQNQIQRPLNLFQIAKDWSSDFKSPIEIDMDLVVADNTWKRLLPGVTTSSTRPWATARGARDRCATARPARWRPGRAAGRMGWR